MAASFLAAAERLELPSFGSEPKILPLNDAAISGPPGGSRTRVLGDRSSARRPLRYRRSMVRPAGLEPARAGFGGQPPQSRGEREWWTWRESNPRILVAGQACSHYHYRPSWTTAAESNRAHHALQACASAARPAVDIVWRSRQDLNLRPSGS